MKFFILFSRILHIKLNTHMNPLWCIRNYKCFPTSGLCLISNGIHNAVNVEEVQSNRIAFCVKTNDGFSWKYCFPYKISERNKWSLSRKPQIICIYLWNTLPGFVLKISWSIVQCKSCKLHTWHYERAENWNLFMFTCSCGRIQLVR